MLMAAQSVRKTAIGMLHKYPNAPAPGARPVYWLVEQDGALDGVAWEHKGWLMPQVN